jgi:anti-anti-sigma factor
LEITVSKHEGDIPVTVLHLEGSLGAESEAQLTGRAKSEQQAGMRNAILDLSKVDFMSSAGLRGIHTIYSMLRNANTGESDEAVQEGIAAGTYKSPHLKLASANDKVREVLTMTGYDMFLEMHKDVEAALKSFSA